MTSAHPTDAADAAPATDPTMDAILAAVALGREGDVSAAREQLEELWARIGPLGDPLHRCALAHYLADLHAHPAEALVWDVRSLDAADAVTEERTQAHHSALHIAGFYPSLHLNLADNHRRLGSFDAATAHIAAARSRVGDLPDDTYGAWITSILNEVAAAVDERSTEPRPSAPGPG